METLKIQDDYALIHNALMGIEVNYFDHVLEKTGILNTATMDPVCSSSDSQVILAPFLV